jgi:hypothetical protein
MRMMERWSEVEVDLEAHRIMDGKLRGLSRTSLVASADGLPVAAVNDIARRLPHVEWWQCQAPLPCVPVDAPL